MRCGGRFGTMPDNVMSARSPIGTENRPPAAETARELPEFFVAPAIIAWTGGNLFNQSPTSPDQLVLLVQSRPETTVSVVFLTQRIPEIRKDLEEIQRNRFSRFRNVAWRR
jgi:hypothetical protein